MKERDKLESYFREQFDQLPDEGSPSGWDTPSRRVWENVEHSIPDYRRRRRWWPLVALLLFLTSAFFAWQWYQACNQLHLEQERLQQHIARLDALEKNAGRGTSAAEASAIVSAPPIATTPAASPASSSIAERPAALSYKEAAAALKDYLQRAEESSVAPSTRAPAFPGTTHFSFDEKTRATATPAEAQPPASTSATPSMLKPLQPSLLGFTLDASLLNASNAVEAPRVSPAGKWSVEVGAAPVATTRWLNYRAANAATRFERQEHATLSWTARAMVGYHFDEHWSVLSGIEWFGYNQRSSHLIAMRFTRQNGHIDSDGRLLNTYYADLPTSFGDASVEVRLASDAQPVTDLEEGKLFPMQFTARLDMQQWALPLLVQYRHGSDRWHWVARAGILANWIARKTLQIEDVEALHPRIEARSSRLANDGVLRRLADFSLDAMAGVGLRYQVSSGLGLQLMPSVRTNLTALSDTPKLRTHLYAWSVSVGAVWEFE